MMDWQFGMSIYIICAFLVLYYEFINVLYEMLYLMSLYTYEFNVQWYEIILNCT
jgi:hypothetical protein